MLKYYVRVGDLNRLCADNDGVVSFEYIVVATCIIIVVLAVYSGTSATSISGALSTGIGQIAGAFANVP
jgi:pilus assembly protein Flp/PilA